MSSNKKKLLKDRNANNRKIWAKIKTTFEAIHSYPKSPKEVKFLQHPHRHVFYVTVWIEQFHNDRDVEFIIFKRFLNNIIKNSKFPQHASCELIADIISKKISQKHSDRKIKIEISEDNENGTFIEYEKE